MKIFLRIWPVLWDWEAVKKKADAFGCAGQLVELAVEYGFEGNLWHCFLALCLADNENAYTTTCEIRGNAGGTLDMLARNDYRIFKALFDFNIETLEPAVMWKELADYRPSTRKAACSTAESETVS